MTAALNAATAGDTPGRPARPVRDMDPARNAAYWRRIERVVATAPPLTDAQRAALRIAFQRPQTAAARATAHTSQPEPGQWSAHRQEAS